jgi:LysM repeat protein
MIVDQLFTTPTVVGNTKQFFSESRHNKMLKEDVTYRKFHNLSRMLAERKMSEKEILDLFASIEAGANASGQNRTALGRGKDAVSGAYTSAKDAIGGVLNSIAKSTPVAGVDAAYNDATGALRNAVGANSKVMDSIKKYRLLAKEYPKTQLFVKTALIALAGMATGGAGLPAIAGLTAAIDAAIKGEKLSSIIGKGAGAALMGLGAQKLQAALAGGSVPADQTLSPGEEIASINDKFATDKFPAGEVTDYVVKKGDTLSDIAKANNVSVDDLMKANAGQTIVKPNGQSITWNDANALSDVNAMGDYTGPGTGVQQDYSVSTSPKIANPDVLAVGQTIKIPAPTGATPYAGDVGLAGDTWKKIGTGAYPYSQISANQAAKYGLKENVKLKTLPANQLIDQKLTVMAWALHESAGKAPARNIHLTHTGVLTVIENVDRHRRALLKELDAMGPGRANIPAVPRPDMPGVAAQPGAVQPGTIGRGLNWLDKQAGKVGNYFTKQAQNFTRKVTAAKLKTEWEQLGHFTDSDEIAAFLAKQGVPQGVISDVYGKMGIPITAPVTVPDGTPAPQQQGGAGVQTGDIYAIDPATGKPYEKEKLAAKWNAPAQTTPAPAPTPTTGKVTKPANMTSVTSNPAAFNATNVMQMPGMEKYVKPAAPAKPANFGASPAGYGKVTQTFKAPAAPAAPKAPAGQKLTPAEYVKKIGAPALPENKQPVAETIAQVKKMLETVQTKDDVTFIKKYINRQFLGQLSEAADTQRSHLLNEVTRIGALRRRKHSQQLAR